VTRTLANARRLRSNLTDAERRLWNAIRQRQVNGRRFRRQAPIGRYIVDFVCFEEKLILEVDGGQHATRSDQDSVRTAWLEGEGFTVLRFWNSEVLGNFEGVLTSLSNHLQDTPHPNPPPQGGRGLR
jgi:very-short-patch-repair endonuclease